MNFILIKGETEGRKKLLCFRDITLVTCYAEQQQAGICGQLNNDYARNLNIFLTPVCTLLHATFASWCVFPDKATFLLNATIT